tara:strand:- start:24412 stop:24945 length:534 start_codon:yes stop_codon:yes gene_type:complete
MQNKKASLELSIRVIVIVILAMTLLGLGLAFVRNTFSDISDIREDVTEQVRQNIISDLKNNDKKASFPKTEIEINKGSSEVLTVGIRNKEDGTLSYQLFFNSISGPADYDPFQVSNWFQFGQSIYELAPSEADVRNVRLNVPKDAKSGSYLLTFDVNNLAPGQTESYESIDFFIVVT